MNPFPYKQKNKLWFYSICFGLLGAIIGLFLRFAYTGNLGALPLKNILHSHSHIMLLGFVLNAFITLLWIHFTAAIDKKSYYIYLSLQLCVAILLVGFIIQGYAAFTIVFSTLHLWLSYSLLIRLWKRLKGNSSILYFVKIGIVLHFLASIGPYALAPLKILGLAESPWYKQAIFFYLHFQYFGSFFMWFLAILFQQTKTYVSKKYTLVILVGLILLFTHSLDYSFNSWMITLFGAIGSLLLFTVFLKISRQFKTHQKKQKNIYLLLMLVLFLNCLGSIPMLADKVATNRFMLIAWLHLLFLGFYLPFIWTQLPLKINNYLWLFYGISFAFTELILVFPTIFIELFSISIMMQLFLAYIPIVLCICTVHLKSLKIFTSTKYK